MDILSAGDLDQIRNYPIDPIRNPLFFKMRERYLAATAERKVIAMPAVK